MRIYDLRHPMIPQTRRVGVMGSCRVHHPLVELEKTAAVLRVWMDYAVIHNTLEAKQNIAIVQGEAPPDVIVPFIFEPPQVVRPLGEGDDLFQSIDTFLVEISDRNIIRAGDWALQVNFLLRNLIQKHPATLFPWYRELTTQGKASAATVDAAVATLRGGGDPFHDQLADLLRFARLERQSHDDIVASVSDLAQQTPGRWIFVSHFTVPGDEGTLITERRQLRDAIREGAKKGGAEFFDPTVLVEAYGREIALAADGADLYEYAAPFNEVVGSTLLRILHGRPAIPTNEDSTVPMRKNIPTDPIAAVSTVNRELVALHTKRMAKLGRDESGLYEHYERLLHEASILGSFDESRVSYLAEYLEPFDHYVVYRAGLGELGFALALLGRKVTLWEPNDNRRKAIRETVSALSKRHPEFRKNVRVAEGSLDEIQIDPSENTLGVAFSFLAGDYDEELAAKAVARCNALLVTPRLFVRTRDAASAETEVRALLRKVGFSSYQFVPLTDALLARRSPASTDDQPKLRFVAVG